MPVRNEYSMNEYRIGLASTRYRHENHLNTVRNEYGTPAGLIWIRHRVNTRIRYDFIPLATAKGLIHSCEFCFDSFILIHTFEPGLISYRHGVDGITNLGKGIILYRIHFVPASCKRGVEVAPDKPKRPKPSAKSTMGILLFTWRPGRPAWPCRIPVEATEIPVKRDKFLSI